MPYQLPNVELVDLIIDKCEALSIKAIERKRRGSTKFHPISDELIKSQETGYFFWRVIRTSRVDF